MSSGGGLKCQGSPSGTHPRDFLSASCAGEAARTRRQRLWLTNPALLLIIGLKNAEAICLLKLEKHYVDAESSSFDFGREFDPELIHPDVSWRHSRMDYLQSKEEAANWRVVAFLFLATVFRRPHYDDCFCYGSAELRI